MPCTINRFTKLVQWSLQERLCKISCINKVCLAPSSIMCITNNNASHPSAHITVGIAQNVLHIFAILNAQKHKYISINLRTKAHSWTLKSSPLSSSSYPAPTAFLTHLFNKLHRLKLFLVCPQWTPQKLRLPTRWGWRAESGPFCPPPGQQRASYNCQPLAPPDFRRQPCSTVRTPLQRELRKSLNLII